MLLARSCQQGHRSTQRRFLTHQLCTAFHVDASLLTILLDTTQDVVHVIREESLRIQHRLNHPSDRLQAHGLVVRVLVPLDTSALSLLQCTQLYVPLDAVVGA